MSATAIEPIRAAEVEKLADLFDRHGLYSASLEAVRQVNPDRRITLCSEDDISVGRPVASRDGFDVYLVSGESHCLTLTNDFDRAIGIVIAERES
ncbi:MAG: DUF6129 family protein [Planctomycetota bacterium]